MTNTEIKMSPNYKRVAIVVPTIRPDSFKVFLNSWLFHEVTKYDVHLFVIEDNPKQTITVPNPQIDVFSWHEINETDFAPIIPRRTDCIRSFGFWLAYQWDADYVITLDDDCLPLDGMRATEFIDSHINALSYHHDKWVWTTKDHKSRGVPYGNTFTTETLVNMGFWRGVTDHDAVSQLVYGEEDLEPNIMSPVPGGVFFPMCGMNLSFKRAAIPMMYFLLMGKGERFDRFGDIWCGLFAKKISDHLGYAMSSGTPSVHHERASNVWNNFDKEHSGLPVNEEFWQVVDKIRLKKNSITACYVELAQGLKGKVNKDIDKIADAMMAWGRLYV